TPSLYLQKTLLPSSSAVPGGHLDYQISYGNSGTADATGVVITDALPAYTSSPLAVNGVVTFNIGTVAAKATGSVMLSLTLAAVFPDGGASITNSATLSANGVTP